MANATPATVEPKTKKKVEEENGPQIEYYGEGAKSVKFDIDPRAKLIRVYGNGTVMVDY